MLHDECQHLQLATKLLVCACDDWRTTWFSDSCDSPLWGCQPTAPSDAARVGSILFFSHIDDVGRLGAVVGRSSENRLGLLKDWKTWKSFWCRELQSHNHIKFRMCFSATWQRQSLIFLGFQYAQHGLFSQVIVRKPSQSKDSLWIVLGAMLCPLCHWLCHHCVAVVCFCWMRLFPFPQILDEPQETPVQ